MPAMKPFASTPSSVSWPYGPMISVGLPPASCWIVVTLSVPPVFSVSCARRPAASYPNVLMMAPVRPSRVF